MNRVKYLQTKKLFKELDYIESDFEYRNEIISDADSEFISHVNNFLEEHPKLKEIYDERIDKNIQTNIFKNIEDVIENYSEEDHIYENKPNKVKKLYREIVKLTHPDKVFNKSLNNLYLLATDYYDNNDKIGIYKVCSKLEIDYELDVEDNQIIKSRIQYLKRSIEFLESTFTWQWINTQEKNEKNEMLLDYIKLRLK